MDEARLAAALAGLVGRALATDLAHNLVKIRRDCATRTLGHHAVGKFVETFVQSLQQIDTGKHDAAPNIDDYLSKRVENTSIHEGLRICAARVARSMYTFRNKRNIAHKNPVDTNIYDLTLAHHGAAWITAELLRHASGIWMQEAGVLIAMVQSPVGTLIEEIDGVRLVHADVSTREELLLLLHSHYPDTVAVESILKSLSRLNAAAVRARLRELHASKHAHGSAATGYKLTQPGYDAALKIVGRFVK